MNCQNNNSSKWSFAFIKSNRDWIRFYQPRLGTLLRLSLGISLALIIAFHATTASAMDDASSGKASSDQLEPTSEPKVPPAEDSEDTNDPEVTDDPQENYRSTVGMPVQIKQLVLPGPKLIVKPLEDRNDRFVLRLVADYRHGTDYRYDFECYGLEPGTYELANYLVREDGTEADGLPKISIEVKSILDDGQVLPSSLSNSTFRWLGGYRVAAFLAALIWLGGFFALVFVGRKRKVKSEPKASLPITPIDEIRPFLLAASRGELTKDQHGELERALIAYWTDRLSLNALSPVEVSAKLKDDAIAGPMLSEVERWLHAPEDDPSFDLASVLKPIEQASAEETAAQMVSAEANSTEANSNSTESNSNSTGANSTQTNSAATHNAKTGASS